MKEKRHHILVVEDDVALASMYKSALRFAGFEVHLATDGITALWQVDQNPPDLVVLDLHLPGLRGEAVLNEIKANSALSAIPVVVVTASDAELAIAEARAILRKPIDPGRLVSVVEQHVLPAA